MRIPWYIVTLLALGVIISGAWLSIREADFTSPPTAQAVDTSVAAWKENYPPLPDKPKVVKHKLVDIPSIDTPVAKEPAPPEIPIGSLAFSPALNHFTEHASFSSASFIQLAKSLSKTPEHRVFATLAWERAIDTGKPDTQELHLAETSLLQLAQHQPAWWADTHNSLLLDVHISVPEESLTDKEEFTKQLLQSIRDGSGYLVIPNIVWRHKEPSHQVWLKAPSDKGSTSHKIKLVDAVLIKPSEEDSQPEASVAPIDQATLYQAVFDSIASTLRFSASPEPPRPSTLSPKDSLSTALTRLHWQAFAHLLHGIKPAPEAHMISE
ncbi:hypothetical protein [Rubritalea marina]|uniref:hypothetical protein n=1 Tax=Rubritalea marina TaxID=361055 RepID=UPI0003690999|nr:hypothetical protein [Rubritalea marina]